MNAKSQTYLWAFLLTLIGTTIIIYKNSQMSFPLTPGKQADVWAIEALMEFETSGKPVKSSFTLPGYFGDYQLLDENSASQGFGFTKLEQGDSTKGVWTIREANGPQKIYYSFSIFDTGIQQDTGSNARPIVKPFFAESHKAAVDTVINSAWEKSADIKSFLSQITSAIDDTSSQDAHLIKTLIQDNYTKVHLIRDMLLHKGINAVAVRGLQLEDGKRRATSHFYLAVLDKKWEIINPATGDYGVPEQVIFWKPGSMFEVEGAYNSQVTFSMIKSRQSAKALALRSSLAKESPLITFSIYSLPLEFQTLFRTMLLIPVGCLIVVIMRNLVGLPTSGTFMPVLLALAFLETTLSKGIVVLLVILALGLLIRTYLSRMNLLLVPRISAVVICVVLLMGLISVISFKLGIDEGVNVTLFPMIIISWTIERTSILWEEHGSNEVFSQMGGSLFVSILVYLAMTNEQIKYFTFTFPEVMLPLLAIVLLVGTYTGYRLTELFRFEPLVTDSEK